MEPFYQPAIFQRKSIRLDRFLVLGRIPCPEKEYDLFSLSEDPQIRSSLDRIFAAGDAGFPVFTDCTEEGKNTFRTFDGCQHEKLYLYTEVICKARTRILVQIACNRFAKLWLNGEPLTIHTDDRPIHMSAYLKKGKNVFLLERYNVSTGDLLSIRLYDYQREMSSRYDALSQLSSHITIDPVLFISNNGQYLPDSESYRFMFFTPTESVYESKFYYEIHDTFEKHLSDVLEGHMNQPITVELTSLRNLREETFRYVGICHHLKKKTGEEERRITYLILRDFPEARKQIPDTARSLVQNASPEVREHLSGLLDCYAKTQQSGDAFGEFWRLWDIKLFSQALANGSFSYVAYLFQQNAKEVYLRSQLDNTMLTTVIRIPQGFRSDKKYPAVFSVPMGYQGYFSWEALPSLLPEEALCFDLNGRGATGGSYIGEAQINELISWARNTFPIDEDRIYLIGQSNGGYGVYAIAQNHPDLAAAIYPQVGYPHIPSLLNLSNTPTYQTVSTGDYIFKKDKNQVKRRLARFQRYHQYDFEDLTHNQMLPFLYHRDIFKSIFRQKRNPYPREIHFTTVRNRHCQSFWLRLHGIAFGQKTASVCGKIKNSQEICLRLQGSCGITVTIPPEIDRTEFTVQINRHRFVFQNCYEETLIFRKEKNWQMVSEEPSPDYRKGTGILDVYLNSLRIVIPSQESGVFFRTAEAFSHPKTNAYLPDVAVRYPILRDGEDNEMLAHHNLILIDDIHAVLTNPISSLIEKNLPVQCRENGIYYKDNFYEGDYVVMQVTAHPCNTERSILCIRTNAPSLLSRCLFTRQVVLPFYHNGLHPFYNNEVLIFQQGRYCGIYEPEGELSEIL